jgi:DNA ligase (NAD+)
MDQKQRIDEIVHELNQASDAYYGGQEERITNFEWDALFDELTALEAQTGYIRADSPTQTTSHAEEDSGAGEKEPHEYPALSLAKTKNIKALQEWAGEKPIWLSWKLDGLTLVLTYDGGKLTRILTRGNGTVGTNITYMQHALRGFPLKITEKGHLVVRGEATISYTDFEAINDTLEDADDKYANPRNLASGTLALDKTNLDKVKERNVTFHAFTLVHTDVAIASWGARMDFLTKLGFDTVEREALTAPLLPDAIHRWTARVDSGAMDLPVDGLVITYDDTEYAATGSITGHHATRAGLAYKWQDVSAVSLLDHIEWSCAASTITPVAVFAPVQLEGTSVARASLCNISELERLGIGANGKTKLEIIKANKIIPKCISVVSAEGQYEIPATCPVCGAKTEVRESPASGTKTLRCTNSACPAKHLKRFARFVSKTGVDIDGLSIQTLMAFVNRGFIRGYADIYRLGDHAGEIVTMEGMGEKSCANLLAAIEKSRRVNPVNLIFALCIPTVGIDAGKKIIAALGSAGFFDRVEQGQDFADVDGIGPERSGAILTWFADEGNRLDFEKLMQQIQVEEVVPRESSAGRCAGLAFVITGEVHQFENRDDFKAYVEREGGSVTGSVSKKTAYLVNNDVLSTTAKNKKANELGIPILSEEMFIEKFGRP